MVTPSDANNAQLIGLDWGSTQLRAMLIGANGVILQMRSSSHGASTLNGSPAGFSAALSALADDWHNAIPHLPLLACGMVGSQHGWTEVSYLPCPASAAVLSQAMLPVSWRATSVYIVPGLACDTSTGVPDVMRGEETQALGAMQFDTDLRSRSCIVMPGTHSKWTHVENGAVRSFATHMTGELFSVLRQHSVLGRLLPSSSPEAPQAFKSGVVAAREHGESGLPHQLFAVRSLGLRGVLPPDHLAEYLSGLLIGHELRSGLIWRKQAQLTDAPLVLVGEQTLCERYVRALTNFDVVTAHVQPNTAALGLWQLAQTELGSAR